MPRLQCRPTHLHCPSRTYTYADCSVICSDPQILGNQQDNILNPLLIVEVLLRNTRKEGRGVTRPARQASAFRSSLAARSRALCASSEVYDGGKKFELYRSIRSFCEYLIVHQDRLRVEHHSRQDDGTWPVREHSGTRASVVVDLNVWVLTSLWPISTPRL